MSCNRTFSSVRRPTDKWIQKAYEDYSIHKQTYAELSVKYKKDPKTLRKYFDEHAAVTGEMKPRSKSFVLILDATFFGRGYGILLARCPKKVLYWAEIETEKMQVYVDCMDALEAADYTFSAFVIDGRRGVRLSDSLNPRLNVPNHNISHYNFSTMKKSFQNEVMKRQFFLYLKEVKGFSPDSVDAHDRAVLLWQECHENKDFMGFGKQQVRAFKDWLKSRTNRKGEPLSLVYRYHVLRRLRLFFEWLSMQPHYKSKINPTVIEFLSLSKKETRIAIEPNKRKIPPMEDVIKVIEAIDPQTEVDQRDRALICFTLLTGARISAIYSLPMKAFEPSTLTVDQNPKFGVKTKFSKRIVTTFFPIEYEEAMKYFLDWYKYLERKKGFSPDDPIFPQAIVENGEENINYHNTGEVEPVFWSSSNSVRKIFQKRFLDAEIPYYHPHTFRHLVVTEFAKSKLTEEEKKAISQNLGHENTGTTFGSYGYGHIQEERQIEIVKNIKLGEKEIEGKLQLSQSDIKALAKALKAEE